MPTSKAQAAETAARRARLIRMRRAGHDFQHIADTLGYASRGAASKDLIRALEQHREEESAELGFYRQQENERLDNLLAAVWERATTPSPVYTKDGVHTHDEIDLRAVDTVLRLIDRRAKLNGLDAPARTELSGPDGGAVPLGTGSLAELNALIAIAGQTGPATQAAPEPGGEDQDDEATGDDER